MGSFSNPVERVLGKVCADLNYATVDDVLERGLHEYLDELRTRMNEVDEAVRKEFFSLTHEVSGRRAPQRRKRKSGNGVASATDSAMSQQTTE